MNTVTMAFLHPTEGLTGDDKTVCEQLWAKTTELLTPNLGRLYKRFKPAGEAWGESIGKPFGVVLGRSDPRQFLVLYANARERQEEAVKFHMGGFLGNFDMGERFDEDGLHGFTMNPKEGKDQDISAHLSWHLSMMAGQLMPDAGIYRYAAQKRSFICGIRSFRLLSAMATRSIRTSRFREWCSRSIC